MKHFSVCSDTARTLVSAVKDWKLVSQNGELGFDEVLNEQAYYLQSTILLKHYGRAKALSKGRLLHSQIMDCGYCSNTFVGNSIVQMYANCGSLSDARAVFDNLQNPNLYSLNILIKAYGQNDCLQDAMNIFYTMPQRDIVSWTTTIGAFLQNGHGKDALNLFHRMLSESFQPNDITFICALDACASLAAFEEGKRIHAAIIHREGIAALGTSLVNMYSKCGSLDNARSVFSKICCHDIVSWTSMIGAFAYNGHGKNALDLFLKMQCKGVKPNCVTFVGALDACASIAAINAGQNIHALIVEDRSDYNTIVGNALVHMYSKCGNLSDAKNVFWRMLHRNVISWTAMIGACAENGHENEAVDLFHRMQFEGLKPNEITFVCALDACTSLKHLEEGKLIHATAAQNGYEHDMVVGTALVSMYGKLKSLDRARCVFIKMCHHHVVFWNAMMGALVHNEKCQEAVNLFFHMVSEGINPNSITFVSALDACATVKALKEGQFIHDALLRTKYTADVIVATALINMYSNCGSLGSSRGVFGRMVNQDVTSWNAMITACTHHGNGIDALDLFHQMQQEGFKADNITFVIVLNACASLAAFEAGQEIHAVMVDCGCGEDLAITNALINMYGKCGSLNNAISVFGNICLKDVSSWTALIAAFAQNGHGKEALASFYQMECEGVEPNDITFTCMLTACSHAGLVDAGKLTFISMKIDYCIGHTIDHYLCIVDLLSRAGHLDEAEDIISEMPSNVGAQAWLSLLGACGIHGDVERVLRIVNQCLNAHYNNTAPYVMLSNIFATAGR